MRTSKISFFSFLLTFLTAGSIVAQNGAADYPVIGQQIPAFTLNNIHYYPEKIFDPMKVKDKWVILDFWNTHCTSCVQSFPKVNALQEHFKDKIQFVLIGQNDQRYNKNIAAVYERYRKNFQLNIASAYDSVLFDQFKIQGVPYVIIIDPSHKVYAITYGSELNANRLQQLISDKHPVFLNKSGDEKTKFWEYWKNERDSTIVYQSILSRFYKGELSSGTWNIEPFAQKGYFYVTGVNLFQLYNIAYWGIGSWGRRDEYFTNWKQPILETKDSAAFAHNYSDGSGLYNYSLNIPLDSSSKQYLMQMMQRELKNYFNYNVVTETRLMPCWVLTASGKAAKKLISRSDQYECESGPAGVTGKKIPVDYLLEMINNYNGKEIMPFLDETRIEEPIDIDFKAALTDLKDVIQSLKIHGLILQQAMRPMKVLVIRDK